MNSIAPTGLRFAGFATALPDRILTNHDLSESMDTSDEWIRERTGIGERRVGSTTSELSIAAARAALDQSGLDAGDISQIVLATTTPDYIMPGTAPAVAHALGTECGAFDVQAVCSGWVYGMVVANGLLHQGLENVLLIGADAMSKITDYTDRGTGILFGNGAGAAVLQRNSAATGELLGWDLGSNGAHVKILYSEHGDTIQMDGKEVFRQAVTVMQRSIRAATEQAGIGIADLDFVIPHQANIRIVQAAWKRLGIPMEKTGLVLDRTGNTSSASIPLALGEAIADGRITDGSTVAFLGFGAGMTWGCNIIRWHGPDRPETTTTVSVPEKAPEAENADETNPGDQTA